jgi:short-subunit dehydrogenase
MNNSEPLRGKWSLVTGASSGIGADLSRELAQKGSHLIIVARREHRLKELQAEVQDEFGISVDVIPLDLATADAPQTLYDLVKAAGREVDVLVNNAGYGIYGEFIDIPWKHQAQMLTVDIITLTHLTRLFLPEMVERDSGRILLVSSVGAYSPTPLYATYSAAKSYVLSFGEALNYELRETGISCTVLVPTIVRTAFRDVAGQETTRFQRLYMTESAAVARSGVAAMFKGKSTAIPGFKNRLLILLTRFLPRSLATAIAYQTMR